MVNKTSIIDSLKDLPESFSAEELINRIILLDKIDEGLKQAQEGKSINDEEIEEQLAKWLS